MDLLLTVNLEELSWMLLLNLFLVSVLLNLDFYNRYVCSLRLCCFATLMKEQICDSGFSHHLVSYLLLYFVIMFWVFYVLFTDFCFGQSNQISSKPRLHSMLIIVCSLNACSCSLKAWMKRLLCHLSIKVTS